MKDLTAFRDIADKVMQAAAVVEETICILMSAAGECRRNQEIKVVCLGVVQPALMREMSHYLQWIWPTLKKVQGYDEDKEDVKPRILAARDLDCRHVARQVMYRLSNKMPGWNPELLISYCQKQVQEVVKFIREIQFTDKECTFDQYRNYANALLAEAGLVLKDLDLENQKVIEGRHFNGKGPVHYAMRPNPYEITVDRSVGCDVATSKVVKVSNLLGQWLFCRLTAVLMIDTLKSRVRAAVGEDSTHTDRYRLEIEALQERLKVMNSDQEVHPIEIAYLRDLIEGMKPNKAASKRKDRYRAATQRRLKAEERSVDAQHRDRQLLQKLSGLSRRDLYENDAIDKAIESSTEVVDATGVVLTENTDRESAFRERTEL